MSPHRLWGVILTLALTPVCLVWLWLALMFSQTQCDTGPCGLGEPWAGLQLLLAAAGIFALEAVGPLLYTSKVSKLRLALLGGVGAGLVWVLVAYSV